MTSAADRETKPIGERLTLPQFPRTSNYDPAWLLDNVMGPNALWLAESLSEVVPLTPGMRVLDLGCGKAVTPILLAKEFGVRVWAGELWINPTENWNRIKEAGVEADVVPMKLEAHAIPFTAGFFDAVVSFDTAQRGGAATGHAPVRLRLKSPTPFPTAGNYGFSGSR